MKALENKEIYALEDVSLYCYEGEKCVGLNENIFLAGPTPRSEDVKSWRPQAINILRELGYKGNILIPEPRNGGWAENYYHQVEWELESLNKSTGIIFWIPRNMDNMPGMTTNIELGYIVGSKYSCESPDWIPYLEVGFPENAPHTRYISALLKYHSLGEPSNTLEATCQNMLKQLHY